MSRFGYTSLGFGSGSSAPFTNVSSVSFDGVDDYCYNDDVTSAFSVGTGAFSVSLWVYPRSTPGVEIAFTTFHGPATPNYWDDYSGIYIQWVQYGIWRAGTSSKTGGVGPFTYIDTAASYSKDNWFNLVFTRDGAQGLTLYVNGSSAVAAAEASPTDVTADDNGLGVGSGWYFDDPPPPAPGGPGGNFNSVPCNCLIDEVALFTSELTAGQVDTLYNNPDGPTNLDAFAVAPALWWRMGDGTEQESGTTIYDMSANSHNATLYNGPTYSSTVPS